jgi:hypothetical protein
MGTAVVAPAAAPIHADANAPIEQRAREGGAGELRALVGVHDRRTPIARDRFLEGRNAEGAVERDRDSPAQEPATRPIHHRREINEAVRHRDVRAVHRPDLVRLRDQAMAQEIREHGVGAVPAARARLRTDHDDAHVLHQRANTPTPDTTKVGPAQAPQHPGAGEREVEVECIDREHQCEIPCRYRARHIVRRAAADAERLGLTRDRQPVPVSTAAENVALSAGENVVLDDG